MYSKYFIHTYMYAYMITLYQLIKFFTSLKNLKKTDVGNKNIKVFVLI